jgi:hypothetical protein
MTQNTYISDIEKTIRQNSLKYKGLNTSAEEFVPSKTTIKKLQLTGYLHSINTYTLQQTIIKSNFILSDDLFFDKLEYNFVQQNVWLFE